MYGRFKGNQPEYDALHHWVRKQLGTPSLCEHCGTTDANRYHWANKSQLYLKNTTDWLRLCARCHTIYDEPDFLLKPEQQFPEYCVKGHRLVLTNIYMRQANAKHPRPHTECRTCRTAHQAKFSLKNAEAKRRAKPAPRGNKDSI